MASSPSELSLECKPQSYSMLLKSFGDQTLDQTQKLEEFLSHLEEERLKIDAFKRELPLCMQLLTNAMEASRQQLQTVRASQGSRPVLEEFIPLKHPSSEGSEKASNNTSDKATWMTSAQLWSQAGGDQGTNQPNPKETDIAFGVCPRLTLDNKNRTGGAFLPFSKERNLCPSPALAVLPDLALASAEKDQMEDKKCSESSEINGLISCPRREISSGKGGANGGTNVGEQGKAAETQTAAATGTNSTTTANNTQSTHRKARRCWSPDLHRRFVNALQMLGGSQVATPKQIRELMKVDGLTNDEVKSHLQKYRLHTRRPSPSPQAAGTPAPQLVVLGGIWVPPEYATAAAAHGGATTIYGAHPTSHASPHYCAPPVAQDFYPAPPQPHHGLHHQLQVYKGPSQHLPHGSPDSAVRGAGDRSESIEDGKSESSSWKGDSGENGGGERKGLATRRDDGEESNASEITLKF
ncbi:myb family transcription factor EFM [Malania oleifera]|uniref:myb family transcription factor EFM n=1 Tax=Malania oleifera TaxID=397392 RepID=UPI0025AE2265|nr:myb family transcription factor EFM [Malania oleifera]